MPAKHSDGVQGEHFARRGFVKTGSAKRQVPTNASSGPEAAEQEATRRAAAKARTESNLDGALADTFPASDPMSASPGAD